MRDMLKCGYRSAKSVFSRKIQRCFFRDYHVFQKFKDIQAAIQIYSKTNLGEITIQKHCPNDLAAIEDTPFHACRQSQSRLPFCLKPQWAVGLSFHVQDYLKSISKTFSISDCLYFFMLSDFFVQDSKGVLKALRILKVSFKVPFSTPIVLYQGQHRAMAMHGAQSLGRPHARHFFGQTVPVCPCEAFHDGAQRSAVFAWFAIPCFEAVKAPLLVKCKELTCHIFSSCQHLLVFAHSSHYKLADCSCRSL